MPLVTRYDTPAGLHDFDEGSAGDEKLRTSWRAFLDGEVTQRPSATWLDPLKVKVEGEAGIVDGVDEVVAVVEVKALSWIGFPRASLVADRDDRARAFAESATVAFAPQVGRLWPRGRQFEYFEWFATRDPDTDKITKVAFTTETPEYWEMLWEADDEDKKRVVALYREHVDPAVQRDDLALADGTYDRLNRWTTANGIMHFVHYQNEVRQAIGLATAGAEAAGAPGDPPTPPAWLDNFVLPASTMNAADDYIVREVAALGRNGFVVTVHDPVGLYLDGWDDSGWTKPDGSPVGDYWRITRGRPGAVLRLEYEVPPEEGFVVGDIRIGGRRVEYGGQLAEHMTSSLPVVVARRVS